MAQICVIAQLLDSCFLAREAGFEVQSVKLTQVAIDSTPMYPCTLCLGANCGDNVRLLVTPERYSNKNLILD